MPADTLADSGVLTIWFIVVRCHVMNYAAFGMVCYGVVVLCLGLRYGLLWCGVVCGRHPYQIGKGRDVLHTGKCKMVGP